MFTDDRYFQVLVKINGADDACVNAFAAADAFFRRKKYAAAGSGAECAGRTGLGASALIRAADAHHADKTAGQTAGRANADCTLEHAVFLFVYGGAGEHASKAAQTFIHAVRAKYFCHMLIPPNIHV